MHSTQHVAYLSSVFTDSFKHIFFYSVGVNHRVKERWLYVPVVYLEACQTSVVEFSDAAIGGVL